MSSLGATSVKSAADVIGRELEAYAAKSNRSSHKLCEYALENVLLHQAAGQQLHEAASKVVSTGQQLLVTSRQITPQLDKLAAMAATAKQLRNNAAHLKTIGAALQQDERQHQQRSPTQQQQNVAGVTVVKAAKGPS